MTKYEGFIEYGPNVGETLIVEAFSLDSAKLALLEKGRQKFGKYATVNASTIKLYIEQTKTYEAYFYRYENAAGILFKVEATCLKDAKVKLIEAAVAKYGQKISLDFSSVKEHNPLKDLSDRIYFALREIPEFINQSLDAQGKICADLAKKLK